MKRLWTYIFLASVVAVVLASLAGTSAEAQCAMCRASLAGSNNAAFIKSFNIGVLVLLVPPVAMFCSIFVVLRRSRRQEDETEQD
jgi:hypothetical protein